MPELLCHLRLDGGGLDHADPVPDDRPTSCLIRGPEADWAQARVLRLESRHNVVSLSDVGKLPCIDVERENTSDVGCNGFGTDISYERPDHLSGSFCHSDGDGVPQRSGTEG